MYARVLAFLVLVVAARQHAISQCQPSAETREVLQQVRLAQDAYPTDAASYNARAGILDAGLTRRPKDFFLLNARMKLEFKREDRIQWAEQRRREYPDNSTFELIYALSLVMKDTPRALTLLTPLTANRETAAPAHLNLVENYDYGKFKDAAKAAANLEGYLRLCPLPLDSEALSTIARLGSAMQVAQTTAALRKRLASEHDLLLLNLWVNLWNMEFQNAAADQHEALRDQVAHDVERLRTGPQGPRLESLFVQYQGSEIAADFAAKARAGDRILQDYPLSREARRIIGERWEKDHALSDTAKRPERIAYYRKVLAAAEQGYIQHPSSAYFLARKLEALHYLPDVPTEQILQCVDTLLAVITKYPNQGTLSDVQLQIARVYVKSKVRLDQAPDLVEKAYSTIMAREDSWRLDDRITPGLMETVRQRDAVFAIWRAGVLLDYFEATKQPERARELEAQLQSYAMTGGLKSNYLALRAQAAEIQGHKLDALFLYRDSMAAESNHSYDDEPESAAGAIQRLWKELGGTSETYASFIANDKNQATTAKDLWEHFQHPAPSFALPDLEGKVAKLSDFTGKIMVVNVWATWCPPCREELPQVERFYQATKARNDVVVLTFNIDENLAKVSPFMRENNYTFPVYLARKVVDSVSEKGYPQTWIINRKGVLEWMMVSGSSGWMDSVQAKLEEIQKQSN